MRKIISDIRQRVTVKCLRKFSERMLKVDEVQYFKFFEPCIVMHTCDKNQQNADFFINDLIQL